LSQRRKKQRNILRNIDSIDELFGFFALKNCETAILAKNALRSEATQGQAQARL